MIYVVYYYFVNYMDYFRGLGLWEKYILIIILDIDSSYWLFERLFRDDLVCKGL